MIKNKTLIILGGIFILISNSLTFFITNIYTKNEEQYNFHRECINAGLGRYNQLLDFEFKTTNEIAIEEIEKITSPRKQLKFEVRPNSSPSNSAPPNIPREMAKNFTE